MLCRFCHNYVVAGMPARDHGDRLRGLTQHEACTASATRNTTLMLAQSDCGGRTAACVQCRAAVRAKDMEYHMRIHTLDAAPARSSLFT